MAKRRFVSDGFWSDSWIENLEPLAKYLYIYLLTNQYVSICGIYEIQLKRIAFETGIDNATVSKIIKLFQEDKKIYYNQGVIFIVNFVKNQSIKLESDNLRKGIEREVKDIGTEKLSLVLGLEGAYKVVEGAYKDVEIPYFTLLYSTLPNLTIPIGDKDKQKKSSKELKPVVKLAKASKTLSYGNSEVNLCLEIIKKVNGGIVDGTIKEQRQYANLLVGKIKKIDTVLSGKRSWHVYLSGLMSIVSKSKYDIRKITSPKKIYYDLASLQQVANQQVVEEKQVQAKSSEAFRSFGM